MHWAGFAALSRIVHIRVLLVTLALAASWPALLAARLLAQMFMDLRFLVACCWPAWLPS